MVNDEIYGNPLEAQFTEAIAYFKCLKCGSEIARYLHFTKIRGSKRHTPRLETSFSTREIMNKYCNKCLEATLPSKDEGWTVGTHAHGARDKTEGEQT